MNMSELRGARSAGGADVIVKPTTGEIYRIWKRRAVPDAVVFDQERPGRYSFVANFDRAWLVTLVEAGMMTGGPGREPATFVRWNEPGWRIVMGTTQDEYGFIVVTDFGAEIEPV